MNTKCLPHYHKMTKTVRENYMLISIHVQSSNLQSIYFTSRNIFSSTRFNNNTQYSNFKNVKILDCNISNFSFISSYLLGSRQSMPKAFSTSAIPYRLLFYFYHCLYILGQYFYDNGNKLLYMSSQRNKYYDL